MSISSVKQAYETWMEAEKIEWNLAISLHASNQLRAAERGFDEYWLQAKLRRYFNELDRKLFRTDYTRRGVRMQRLVALGHTDTVGWHAHVCAVTPKHIGQDKLISAMHLLWLKHMNVKTTSNTAFKDKLFWAQPMTGRYQNYTFNNAADISGINSGTHYGNAQARSGTLDILNCHF
jgi:hypothetical protein